MGNADRRAVLERLERGDISVAERASNWWRMADESTSTHTEVDEDRTDGRKDDRDDA